jgi:hypothetical protein
VQGAAHGSSPYQIAPVSQNAKIIVGCCLAVIGDDEYVLFFLKQYNAVLPLFLYSLMPGLMISPSD